MMSLSIIPCIEFDIQLVAALKVSKVGKIKFQYYDYFDLLFQTNQTIRTNLIKHMSRQQPEFTFDAMANVEVRRAVADPSIVTVSGNLDDILVDKECKAPTEGYILFKHEDADKWITEKIDVTKDSFECHLKLTEYCLKNKFQMKITGYPGSDPILADIDSGLDSIEV